LPRLAASRLFFAPSVQIERPRITAYNLHDPTMAEEKNNPHGNREVPDWASGSWNPPHHAPLFGSGYKYGARSYEYGARSDEYGARSDEYGARSDTPRHENRYPGGFAVPPDELFSRNGISVRTYRRPAGVPEEDINFAEILDPQGWRAHAAQKSAVKEKMPRMVFELLSAYLIDTNTSLTRTTFSHIVTFFQTGREAGRLSVACADFGYSVDELRSLRTAGSTALDVAAEIIGRGSR
jgi:hypothetical protein